MRLLTVLLVGLLVGCSSGAVESAPSAIEVEIDPALESPARAALTEWSDTVGVKFHVTVTPVRDFVGKPGVFRFGVGSEKPALARAHGIPEGEIYVRVDLEYIADLGWVTQDGLRRALLHETGHALGLHFEQSEGETDTFHYRGSEPSVMGPELTGTAEHLGQPEIEAYAERLTK